MGDSHSSLGYILLPFADALTFVATRNVSAFFPYPWATTIHAARVSIGYQANVRKTSSHHISWPTYLAGYLIMCFGGTAISSFLLSQPPPQLYSIHPYINYTAVHLALTLLFKNFPDALNPKLFDTFLFPLDGVVRANTVVVTLNKLGPTVNPLLTQSPLFHAILGAISSAGGGTVAATISTWTPEWTLGTPVFLRTGAGFWGTVDVWGGTVVAIIYSTLTGHPAYNNLNSTLQSFGLIHNWSPVEAKALAAAVLTVLFGLRVLMSHWSASPAPLNQATAIKEKKKQ